MSWDRLRDLPLTIESVAFDRQAATFAYGFERITTLVRLIGGGVRTRRAPSRGRAVRLAGHRPTDLNALPELDHSVAAR